mmetsp:Transcript_2813/g.7700  ORF Transcript_2813/g.7700 Transcript_2813/m.7700 type:complete len:248 (+) Transcript_2813:764-1507(+)
MVSSWVAEPLRGSWGHRSCSEHAPRARPRLPAFRLCRGRVPGISAEPPQCQGAPRPRWEVSGERPQAHETKRPREGPFCRWRRSPEDRGLRQKMRGGVRGDCTRCHCRAEPRPVHVLSQRLARSGKVRSQAPGDLQLPVVRRERLWQRLPHEGGADRVPVRLRGRVTPAGGLGGQQLENSEKTPEPLVCQAWFSLGRRRLGHDYEAKAEQGIGQPRASQRIGRTFSPAELQGLVGARGNRPSGNRPA